MSGCCPLRREGPGSGILTVEAVMFHKLARAAVVCASLILVVSRTMSAVHPQAMRQMPGDGRSSAQSAFIVSQLQTRRS
jgi:hypothetical protein